MAESQTSQAWARLAERYRLPERLANGEPVHLSADEIKAVGEREPRLMTKFDTRESRPSQLAGATILPLTNGTYVVLPGDGYHDLHDLPATRQWRLPKVAADLQTLPWSEGPCSESQALDMALAAGVLGDFLGEPRVQLTVRGRRRSPKIEFGFRCNAHVERIVVEGVQIEVDSGLEGEGIHLLEGKLGSRDNFHIRQLYYPLRMWKEQLPEKEVTAVFMTWSNRRFALRRFGFDPLDDYHAIRLVHAVDYVLDEDEELPRLPDVLDRTKAEPLPEEVPFPQADDLRRVIDVVDAVGKGACSQTDIAKLYDFDKRQADYYGNAARFLGLLDRSGRGAFSLSGSGRVFLTSPLPRRNVFIAERIASLPVFRAALVWTLEHQALPDYRAVAEWIAETTNLSGATAQRRSATVLAWTQWLANTFGAGSAIGG
jgi:hypothetical protein